MSGGDYEERFQKQMNAKVLKLRALRQANQHLQEQYNRILAIKNEVEEMQDYIDKNQYHNMILDIADKLGYTAAEDDGALLQAIAEFNEKAALHGFTWSRGMFRNGNKVWAHVSVKAKVEELRGEWKELT